MTMTSFHLILLSMSPLLTPCCRATSRERH